MKFKHTDSYNVTQAVWSEMCKMDYLTNENMGILSLMCNLLKSLNHMDSELQYAISLLETNDLENIQKAKLCLMNVRKIGKIT